MCTFLFFLPCGHRILKAGDFEDVLSRFAVNIWNQIEHSMAFSVGAQENVGASAIIDFLSVPFLNV